MDEENQTNFETQPANGRILRKISKKTSPLKYLAMKVTEINEMHEHSHISI